jgi:catechol 2,3-dioxygenase-like lactoylglutathione lyase family enzyme
VPITDIGIVSVPVTDQDRALAFYSDVLGFEVINDSPMGPGMRWVQLAPPGATTTISLVTWLAKPTPGSSSLLLNTDDLDGDIEKFRAGGIAIGDVAEEFWGRYVMFEDPDGNGIILRGATSSG